MSEHYVQIPGTQIKTKWELVTPDTARRWLLANTENRNKRDKHVAKLAKDMKSGLYQTHHQGVAFDENGILIDGQHRLQAIIISKEAQWMLVTVGLPTEARQYIDGGAKRTAHDFMPGKNKSAKAAAIRILLAIDRANGKFSAASLNNDMQMITAAEVQDNWSAWSDIDELSGLAMHAATNVATCGPSPLLAAALLYPKTAVEFLKGLIEMSGMEKDDPRLALIKYRGGEKRIQTPVSAYAAIKAAKAFSEGKKMTVLRFRTDEVQKVLD